MIKAEKNKYIFAFSTCKEEPGYFVVSIKGESNINYYDADHASKEVLEIMEDAEMNEMMENVFEPNDDKTTMNKIRKRLIERNIRESKSFTKLVSDML